MSTRAERRLKEATDAHQKAQEAHQAAVGTFTEMEAQADRGQPVDPLEYATAEGAVKIKAKHVERTQATVATEQATVDEERERATRRDIVQAAEALPTIEDQAPDLLKAVREYAHSARTQTAAWQKVYDRVRKDIGLFPWEGETAATRDKVSGVPDIVSWRPGLEGSTIDWSAEPVRSFDWSGRPMPNQFWLEGVVYRCPTLSALESQLLDDVRAAFRRAQLHEAEPAAA